MREVGIWVCLIPTSMFLLLGIPAHNLLMGGKVDIRREQHKMWVVGSQYDGSVSSKLMCDMNRQSIK